MPAEGFKVEPPDPAATATQVGRVAPASTTTTIVVNDTPVATPHITDAKKVLAALAVTADLGLSDQEAANRLEQYGPNRIKPPPKANIFKIIFRQVANAMAVILCT